MTHLAFRSGRVGALGRQRCGWIDLPERAEVRSLEFPAGRNEGHSSNVFGNVSQPGERGPACVYFMSVLIHSFFSLSPHSLPLFPSFLSLSLSFSLSLSVGFSALSL